jgi:chaperonin GroEL
MTKLLKFNDKALKSILKGVKTLSKAVKVTLGPMGRNVVINKDFNSITSTKDGASVAKEIILKDKFENIGASLIKEAALKTSSTSGDGTTTATVLAESIFEEGLKHITAGYSPLLLKIGMDKAIAVVLKELTKLSKPIKSNSEIKQIATISANNDEEIGEIISDAIEKVSKDGLITISEGKSIETTLTLVEGMQFDSGYLSPYFITNPEKMLVEYDNPLIFITDKKLSSAYDIVPILEKVSKESRPLVIIAEDIDQDALSTLVLNKIKANMAVVAIKAPSFGSRKKEMLKDISSLVQAECITDDLGIELKDFEINYLGSCKKIKISKDNTTIIDGIGSKEEINKRINQIKAEINNSTSDYEVQKLEERLANLSGGVAVINIGASSETEMQEKKQRVEDALSASKAATKEGVLPGGGVALIRASKAIDNLKFENEEEKIGASIIKKAIFKPAIIIANNAFENGDLIAQKIYENNDNFGYNAKTNKFCDLIKEGVLDPTLVTKNALINAYSIAQLLLTVDCIIVEKPALKTEGSMDPSMGGMGMPGMGMPGMGGMGGMGMPGMM